jgi:uncharacterized CHY-type Zn-finger protein
VSAGEGDGVGNAFTVRIQSEWENIYMRLDDLQHVNVVDYETDCYGGIAEIQDANGSRFVCKKCGQTISREGIEEARWIIDNTDVICPHCKETNQIDGWADAYTCKHCGKTVNR